LSETKARQQQLSYRLFKVPIASVLRTRTLSETQGFLKAIVDVETDRILGFTAFSVGAGEIMGSVQIAMIAGLPFTGLRDAILTHPTLSEVWLCSSHQPQRFTPQLRSGLEHRLRDRHQLLRARIDNGVEGQLA
jgi:pyruvate/2-oxoglutarate dehydrogenase complex dihydrolipoamide dehydrogenase (E3) component